MIPQIPFIKDSWLDWRNWNIIRNLSIFGDVVDLWTVPKMQDILLRVLVVALGLQTYPRHDPTVMHEEKMLRGGEKLDHEMTFVIEEMTHTDDRGHQGDIKNIPEEQNQSDQHVAEEDKLSVLEDVTATKQGSEEDGDQKLLEGGYSMENPQLDHEQREHLHLDMKSKQRGDLQSDGSFIDPSGPQGQQEKTEEEEVLGSKEKEPPLSENETSETVVADWDSDYLWYMWNTFSIISMIHFFRKYFGENSQMKQEETEAIPVTCTAAEVLLPDSNTLQRFHSKCIHVSSDKKWSGFLEGFANDLLDAMRTVCDKNSGVLIEDFQMVDVCDIVVPFTPPEPYGFQCLLWHKQASDLLPATQVGGQIKLVENKKIQNGCHCQSPDADDVLCLLHCETEKVQRKTTDVCKGLLCMKNSPFLSKSQVTKWFQSTIKQAWALISHKYEFELNIRYIDAPGALVIRFRSGKKICFRMNPVVKFNTDAHFFITPCSPNNLDTFWTLSLTNYEDTFLKRICKHLPESSCHRQTLEIAYFLHKRQTAISGSSALMDFHFKTALMHLLLTTDPSQWKPNCVAGRLRDLLVLMEKSLKKKLLQHVLIGNPSAQKIIVLPAELTQAKTVNLFHPLVVHNCIYRNAALHFQEMLKHAHMLIHDYVVQYSDSVN
ncbi:hypothetical protein L3Q82_005258 [Scortum barcoo]|uniref:Uncharacterized protein n=1 Tax=Scortum barcoo TaxID=214431 RepID=A0ACB8V9F8_9TELE|nr:hypothetical protein L3Q82_005258 [Scortum barcoo]